MKIQSTALISVAVVVVLAIAIAFWPRSYYPLEVENLPDGIQKEEAKDVYDNVVKEGQKRDEVQVQKKEEFDSVGATIKDEDLAARPDAKAIVDTTKRLLNGEEVKQEELNQLEQRAAAEIARANQHIKELESDLKEGKEKEEELNSQLKEFEKPELSEEEKKQKEELQAEIEQQRKQNKEIQDEIDTERRILKYLKLALQIAAVFAFTFGNPALGSALLASAALIDGAQQGGQNDGADPSDKVTGTQSPDVVVSDKGTIGGEGVAPTAKTKDTMKVSVDAGMTVIDGTGGGTIYMVRNKTTLEIHDSNKTPTLIISISLERINPTLTAEEQPKRFLSQTQDGGDTVVTFENQKDVRVQLRSKDPRNGTWSKATGAEIEVK